MLRGRIPCFVAVVWQQVEEVRAAQRNLQMFSACSGLGCAVCVCTANRVIFRLGSCCRLRAAVAGLRSNKDVVALLLWKPYLLGVLRLRELL